MKYLISLLLAYLAESKDFMPLNTPEVFDYLNPCCSGMNRISSDCEQGSNWIQGEIEKLDCRTCRDLCIANDSQCNQTCYKNYYFTHRKASDTDASTTDAFYNFTINDLQYNPNQYDPHFSFTNLKTLTGRTNYSDSKLISTKITLEGSITLRNLKLSKFSSFNITLNNSGTLELRNITISPNFILGLSNKNNSQLKIEYLNVSGTSNTSKLSILIHLLNGSYSLIFKQSARTLLNISSYSVKPFQLNNLKVSNVLTNFTVFSSAINVNSSSFKYVNDAMISFTVLSNSSLIFNTSMIKMSLASAPIFTAKTNSKIYLTASDFSDCSENPLANIDMSSQLAVQDTTLLNCRIDNIKKISEGSICLEKYCNMAQRTFPVDCPDGQMDINGCMNCSKGTYRFNIKNQIACFECPESMICEDNTVKPKKKYYRFESLEMAHIIRRCPNPKACKGYKFDSVKNKYFTECEKGYSDIFCSKCDKGYTSTGPNVCTNCPELPENIVFLLATFIACSFVIIYMIKISTATAFKPEQFKSIAIKIGVNYFQIIYFCLQYKIKWPSVGQSTALSEKDGAPSKFSLYFSIQCLFGTNDKTYYYWKVGFMAILPIILFFFTSIYLTFLKLVRKTIVLSHYKSVSFIVPFYLVYPYVITYALSPFACDSLDSNKPTEYDEENGDFNPNDYNYLMEKPYIMCNWSDHFRKITGFTIFSLVIWGLFTPIFIFMQLYRNKKNLFQDIVKFRYGFLLNGYVHDKYYWEFVILFKKLCIVALTVFTQSGYSTTLQSVLLLAFLIALYILQIYCKPYITFELNFVENFASISAIITVLCAVVYTETDNNNTAFQVVLMIVIFIVNIFFTILLLRFMTKNYIWYIILKYRFLKEKFWKNDGFDKDVSKEFKMVNYTYFKEFQKLYTQVMDESEVSEDYLNDNKEMNKMMNLIVATDFERYKDNSAPIIESRERYMSDFVKKLLGHK